MKRFLLSVVLLAALIVGGPKLLDLIVGPAQTLSVRALPVAEIGEDAADTDSLIVDSINEIRK